MSLLPPEKFDQWLLQETPDSPVVVSSRARLARNLPGQPFVPRANAEQLHGIAETITGIFAHVQPLSGFLRYDMNAIGPEERCFLRESYLISTHHEKGGADRLVFLNNASDTSVMINEEDHLRISALTPGLRLQEAYDRLRTIEDNLEAAVDLAFCEEFGYLTACPTNTGTGLRLSVMLHLPALSIANRIEATLADLGSYGLVVRGAYGENTENLGDLYQISNEVSLGKTEEELLAILIRIVHQLVEREMYTRERLRRESKEKVQDLVCRAIGLLGSARRIDTLEAVSLLSKARLGIGQEWGVKVSHTRLNHLFVEVQPAHLQCLRGPAGSPEDRDQHRAELLRECFGGNNN